MSRPLASIAKPISLYCRNHNRVTPPQRRQKPKTRAWCASRVLLLPLWSARQGRQLLHASTIGEDCEAVRAPRRPDWCSTMNRQPRDGRALMGTSSGYMRQQLKLRFEPGRSLPIASARHPVSTRRAECPARRTIPIGYFAFTRSVPGRTDRRLHANLDCAALSRGAGSRQSALANQVPDCAPPGFLSSVRGSGNGSINAIRCQNDCGHIGGIVFQRAPWPFHTSSASPGSNLLPFPHPSRQLRARPTAPSRYRSNRPSAPDIGEAAQGCANASREPVRTSHQSVNVTG